MKKFLMMAFVAVMAFAVQAVTYSWTVDSDGNVHGLSNVPTFKSGVQYTISTVISGTPTKYKNLNNALSAIISSGKDNKGDVFKVIGANDTELRMQVNDPNGTWWLEAFVNKATQNKGEKVPPNTGSKISHIFTGTANDNGLEFTYVDYKESNTHPNGQDVASDYWGELGSISGVYVNPELAGVTFEITILPEPTVLALLALGVAGLALKRKVA